MRGGRGYVVGICRVGKVVSSAAMAKATLDPHGAVRWEGKGIGAARKGGTKGKSRGQTRKGVGVGGHIGGKGQYRGAMMITSAAMVINSPKGWVGRAREGGGGREARGGGRGREGEGGRGRGGGRLDRGGRGKRRRGGGRGEGGRKQGGGIEGGGGEGRGGRVRERCQGKC